MNYIFNTSPNSYFQGQDLRCERTDTHDVVLLNVKDGMWAVNVKSEWIRNQRSQAIQTAADNLTDSTLEHLEQSASDFFWREAQALAHEHGLGDVFQAGRSGGWLAVSDTAGWELAHPAEPVTDGENKAVERFLGFCFAADDLRDTAEVYFDDRILEANMNLQIELSEYAEWVGGEVQTLDGPIEKVERLVVRNGRACLDFDRMFAMATEATLVRKPDGKVLLRLKAGALMEQVFQILESRGLDRAQIDAFLEDEEGNEPARLYQDYISPAISELERQMKQEVQHGC